MNKHLILAASSESSDNVRLVPAGVKDFWGDSRVDYLCFFSRDEDIPELEKLFDSDPNAINQPETDDRTTPWTMAVAVGRASLEFLDFLRAKGADVTRTFDQGITVLHAASNRGKIDYLHYLMNIKKDDGSPVFDVNALDDRGITPLHAACMIGAESATPQGKIDAVKFLLAHGADLSIKNKDGYTAAEVAQRQGLVYLLPYLDPSLEEAPSDPANPYPVIPMITPLERDFIGRFEADRLSYLANDIDALRTSLDRAPEQINMRCKNETEGATPFLVFVGNGLGKIEFLEELIKRGSYVDITYSAGKNGLIMAAYYGRFDVIDLLLKQERCPQIMSTCENGNTALHAACMMSLTAPSEDKVIEMCQFLLNKGVQLDYKNQKMQTAADVALEQGLTKVADYLNSCSVTLEQGTEMRPKPFTPARDAAAVRPPVPTAQDLTVVVPMLGQCRIL